MWDNRVRLLGRGSRDSLWWPKRSKRVEEAGCDEDQDVDAGGEWERGRGAAGGVWRGACGGGGHCAGECGSDPGLVLAARGSQLVMANGEEGRDEEEWEARGLEGGSRVAGCLEEEGVVVAGGGGGGGGLDGDLLDGLDRDDARRDGRNWRSKQLDMAEGMAARRSGGGRGGSFGFWLLVAVAAVCLSVHVPMALGACIDSVCSPKLQFPSSPRAGEQVEMTISFTLDLQFQINDYVEVFLPGFTGALASPPGGGEFLLSWFSETSRLRIQQIQATPAPANVEITAYVSKSDQISLPPFGLETNQADVKMRAVLTAHVNGSTSFRPFEIVEPVGVMLNTTLAFSPDHVGEPVSVELGFTHSSDLEAPDTVSVFLSAFVKSTGTNPESGTASYVVCAGQYSAEFPPDCGGTGSLAATATDVGGGEGVRVDITIADLIRAGESVTVTIPASFGITIPPGGTSLNNQQHVIGTSAALGPVNNPFSQTAPPGTSIESSQEVLSPRIRVEPAKLPTGECSSTDVTSGDCTAWLDESVDLTLGFAHTAAFQEGHYVRFTLPGFTRQTFRSTSWNSDIANITDCSASNCDIASGIATTGANSSEIGNATWIEGESLLELIFTAPVAATRSNYAASLSLDLCLVSPSLPTLKYTCKYIFRRFPLCPFPQPCNPVPRGQNMDIRPQISPLKPAIQ